MLEFYRRHGSKTGRFRTSMKEPAISFGSTPKCQCERLTGHRPGATIRLVFCIRRSPVLKRVRPECPLCTPVRDFPSMSLPGFCGAIFPWFTAGRESAEFLRKLIGDQAATCFVSATDRPGPNRHLQGICQVGAAMELAATPRFCDTQT